MHTISVTRRVTHAVTPLHLSPPPITWMERNGANENSQQK